MIAYDSSATTAALRDAYRDLIVPSFPAAELIP